VADGRSTPHSADLAATGGYNVELFDRLAGAEDQSFWFRARNRLIVELVGQVSRPGDRFLELGCGTGYVLQAVVAACGVRAVGADPFSEALAYARQRVPHAQFLQVDALNDWTEQFDVVGAFDVLEHIEDDLAALRSLRAAVRPGGHVLVTVPQHPWLWSAFDEAAEHVRRYRRADLLERMRQAGLEPVRATSFVVSLLPLMALSRMRRRLRTRNYDPIDELLLPRGVDRVLERMLDLERWVIARGADLPVGGSLVVVARRDRH
jgi:SAM-dependent methyltransferase